MDTFSTNIQFSFEPHATAQHRRLVDTKEVLPLLHLTLCLIDRNIKERTRETQLNQPNRSGRTRAESSKLLEARPQEHQEVSPQLGVILHGISMRGKQLGRQPSNLQLDPLEMCCTQHFSSGLEKTFHPHLELTFPHQFMMPIFDSQLLSNKQSTEAGFPLLVPSLQLDQHYSKSPPTKSCCKYTSRSQPHG